MLDYFLYYVFILVDGNYSNWLDWDACSKMCGNGTQNRIRTCSNPAPSNGGKGCANLGPATQTGPCNLGDCPGGYKLVLQNLTGLCFFCVFIYIAFRRTFPANVFRKCRN